MNQIISKIKNKKIINFLYMQICFSIFFILLFTIYFYIKYNNQLKYFKLNRPIKINLNISNLYNKEQSKFMGNLIIKKLNINLPIFSEYSEENLKISICRYSGGNLGEIGNISIIGHNYKNENFFGNIHLLDINDEIIIKSNEEEYKYKVIKKYLVNEDDLTCLQGISNKCEITLITCDNLFKNKRFIIKAVKI